jgi:hypothetical protein
MSDIRFDRLETKLDAVKDAADEVKDHIASIDTTLALQHQSLVEHIKRTEILEKAIVPIQTHVSQVTGALKFVGILALFATVATGVVDLLHYLGGK